MWRSVAFGVVLTGMLAGCSVDPRAGPGVDAASCAARLNWQNRTYQGIGTAIDPRPGRRLGIGHYPPCNDTGDGTAGSPEAVTVNEIQEVDPERAVQTDSGVFVIDPTHLPGRVASLLHVPACSTATTGGVVAVWSGIETAHRARFDGDIGPPPYRLDIDVQRGPKPLERARLEVTVTSSTTGHLAPADVKRVLWTGGTLALELACSTDGRYQVVRIGQRSPGT